MKDNDFVRNAEDKLDDTLSSEHPRRYADSDGPVSDPERLRGEQFREAEEVGGAPGVPVMTGPMWKGMMGGGVAGAVVGGVIAAPFAFIPTDYADFGIRLLVIVIVGIVAGATAGSIYFGGRAPELSGESVDNDNTPSAGSSLRDPNSDARGR